MLCNCVCRRKLLSSFCRKLVYSWFEFLRAPASFRKVSYFVLAIYTSMLILLIFSVMSSDGDFDHEAYTEYEDQLYLEESLSGSVKHLYQLPCLQ